MKISIYENKNNINRTIMVDENGAQYDCKHHPLRIRAAVLKCAASLASRNDDTDTDLVRMDRGVQLDQHKLLLTVEVKDA
jgi:hypothetical protein